jgi:hypothetical protein
MPIGQGSAVESVLEQTIESASRQIDGLTGDRFYRADAQTRYFTAEDADYLAVDSLRAVTTIKTDEDGDGTYENTWATTDYRLRPVNAATDGHPYTTIGLKPNGQYAFPRGMEAGVEIVGNWGWAAVPHAIREATIVLAIRLFKLKDAPYGIAGTTELGQAVYVPKEAPEVKAHIAPYRRVGVTAI